MKSVNSMLVGVFGLPVFFGMEDGRGGVFWLWSKRKTVGTNAQKSKETPFFAETLKFEGIRKISNQFDLRNL